MQLHLDRELLYLAGVLFLGIAGQWLAWRLRLPSILLLLAFGLAAGNVANPDELIGTEMLFAVVALSVAIILFEGGLTLRLGELRAAGRAVFRLVTIGALVTWAGAAMAAWGLLGFEPPMAVLCGAVLVVTGPTVIVPLLRHIRLVGPAGAVAKWEGIVIDPLGAVLAVLVFEVLRAGGFGEEALMGAARGLAVTLAVGTLVSVATAVLLVQLLKRYWIPDYLQNTVILAMVGAAFTASDVVQPESGLLTVTVLGVLLANEKSVAIKHVMEFKENLRVLLISTLFILLASRLHVSDLTSQGWAGIAFLAALLFVVRPVSVMVATLRTGLGWKERLFLAWLAPRGIVAASVASVFALNVASDERFSPAMRDQADELVQVVFLVVVGTVAVYGLTAGPLARWLKLSSPHPQGVLFAGAEPAVRAMAAALAGEGFAVLLVDTNRRNIASARMSGLPTHIASIVSEYIRNETDLTGIGRLLAMTPNDEVNALASLEFADLFGRAEVYRIEPAASGNERQEHVSSTVRARTLFGKGVTVDLLARRIEEGAVIKKTKLSDEFGYEQFCAVHGPSAIVLFAIEDDVLTVMTADSRTKPTAGQTLISLVDPEEEEETAPAESASPSPSGRGPG